MFSDSSYKCAILLQKYKNISETAIAVFFFYQSYKYENGTRAPIERARIKCLARDAKVCVPVQPVSSVSTTTKQKGQGNGEWNQGRGTSPSRDIDGYAGGRAASLNV